MRHHKLSKQTHLYQEKNRMLSSNTDPSAKPEPLSDSEKKPPKQFFVGSIRDGIVCVLLVLGFILLFFLSFYGRLLIGIALGTYFSKEIVDFAKNYKAFIEHHGLVRSLILGGVALAFLISAPAIFVGAALIVILKKLFRYDL